MSNRIHALTVFLIIMAGGTLGGIFRHVHNTIFGTKFVQSPTLWQVLLLGVIGAAIVPLILHLMSSDLLQRRENEINGLFVFSALCIIAGAFSLELIPSTYSSTLETQVKNQINSIEKRQEVADIAIDKLVHRSELDHPDLNEMAKNIDELHKYLDNFQIISTNKMKDLSSEESKSLIKKIEEDGIAKKVETTAGEYLIVNEKDSE